MSETTVYVSYALDDVLHAERLCAELIDAGYSIAVNRHTVAGGVPLRPALRSALAGAVAFVACFSCRDGAPTSYELDEVELAAEMVKEAPRPGWLIPVKLTPCEIPKIAVGEYTLDEYASVDLHTRWEMGIKHLLRSLPPVPRQEPTGGSAGLTDPPRRSTVAVNIGVARGKELKIIGTQGDALPLTDVSFQATNATMDITTIVGTDGKRGPA